MACRRLSEATTESEPGSTFGLEYARDKPGFFKNNITKVAIVGAGGNLGQHIVAELLKTGKHEVTALTREGSTSKMPEGVTVKKINYDDLDTVVDALEGKETLIITLKTTAPKPVQQALIDAAAAAGVTYVIPNDWGLDPANRELNRDILPYPRQLETRSIIEATGVCGFISICCGFWYEQSLAFGGAYMFGIDWAKRTFNMMDYGYESVNTTTWPQISRAVARLLSLNILKQDENDTRPCLQQFQQKVVYVSSFLINQREILESAMRVTNTEAEAWKVTHEHAPLKVKAGQSDMQRGDRMGHVKQLYARAFYPDGGGNYQVTRGLANVVLGLPEEDLDEYTKIAYEMWQRQGSLGVRGW